MEERTKSLGTLNKVILRIAIGPLLHLVVWIGELT